MLEKIRREYCIISNIYEMIGYEVKLVPFEPSESVLSTIESILL